MATVAELLKQADKEGFQIKLVDGQLEIEGPDNELAKEIIGRKTELVEHFRQPAAKFDEFPADCLNPPGMIEQIIEYTMATSLYPQPELSLAAAIALMGTITGRKVTDRFKTRTNVYVLGLSPSGSGKERPRKVNKRLLIEAGGEHLIAPERIASSAGLTAFTAEKLTPLFQLDEIGRLLATMKNPGKASHLYNIGTVLMQMYSSSDELWVGDAYADMRKTPRINQPHPVVFGTSVNTGFWENLTSDNISEGLLGRMMVFESRGYVKKQRPSDEDPPKELVDAIHWWVDLTPGGGNLGNQNPKPIVAKHSQEALERFETHLDEIDDRKTRDTTDEAALWSRSGEKAAKLALIFACSRQQYSSYIEIDLQDVDRGIRISNWLTRKMLRMASDHVSQNETEAALKKVLRALNGSPLTGKELSRKTQWLKRRERIEIIDSLIESGDVVTETVQTAGRPRTVYRRTWSTT